MIVEFEKISVQQILVFSEIVNGSSLLQKEYIEKTYLRNATHFDETVKFLQELGLIETKENKVVLKPKYEECLIDLKEVRRPKEKIKKFIIDYFVSRKSFFAEYLNEFLGRFQLVNGQYEFAPNALERLKYSGLRNLLIDLGLLYLDPSETKYVVVNDYSSLCSELQATCRISPKEFLVIRQAKEDVGRAAELRIIEYERERLSRYPHIAEKIEHTAKYDVKAGYDIKSYEIATGDNQCIPKYIEVKAVSIIDHQFFWSRNEMEQSEIHRHNYYLYLLPVKGENEFYLEHLKIIRDPYLNVFNNSSEWEKTIESLSFSLISGSKE